MNEERTRIYIAGPYTKGDVAQNVSIAMSYWTSLWHSGFAPFCPHLSHFIHLHSQQNYEDWIEYDLIWLRQCEALIRIPGESAGADREVAEAERLGILVFFSFGEAIEWSQTKQGESQ